MALPSEGKLVRDRIPQIVRAQGATFDLIVLEDVDMWEALNAKLIEEATELAQAQSEDQLEELADVYEVLLALIGAAGNTLDEVKDAAEVKRCQRGGFGARLWMHNYRPS